MSRRPGGAMPPCPGPCFALRVDGRSVRLACLAVDVARARRRRPAELRLRDEAGVGGDRRGTLAPACRASLACRVYGIRVGVRANDRGVLERVWDHLPPGWRPVRGPTVDRLYSLVVPRRRGIHALYGDAARLIRARTMVSLLDALESDLQLHVAERAPRRVFIHAGVVGWRGDRKSVV